MTNIVKELQIALGVDTLIPKSESEHQTLWAIHEDCEKSGSGANISLIRRHQQMVRESLD